MTLTKPISVTKRKRFVHIIGDTYENKDVTENELAAILAESEEHSDEDQITDIKANRAGVYCLSDGDFDYYIEINT